MDTYTDTEGLKTIAERLCFAMKIRGYNPNKLAKAAGIHATTVKNYIDGNGRPDPLKLDKISYVLDVNIEWLKDGEGEMVAEKESEIQNSNLIELGKLELTPDEIQWKSNEVLHMLSGIKSSEAYMILSIAQQKIMSNSVLTTY